MNDEDFKIDESHRKDIEACIEEFERQIAGLPKFIPQDAPEYLEISLEQLRKKTPDELSEAIFSLTRYGMYLQRLVNKQRAWERWGRSKLDEISAHVLPDVPTRYGFNERELLAKNNHPLCKRLNSFIRKVRMEMDVIWGMPEQIKLLTDSIREIKYSAIKREKEYSNG